MLANSSLCPAIFLMLLIVTVLLVMKKGFGVKSGKSWPFDAQHFPSNDDDRHIGAISGKSWPFYAQHFPSTDDSRHVAVKSGKSWPFYALKPLTKPEQVLYHRLVNALPEHMILAQVQLSRVLGVKRGHNFGQWHNRINRMSLDFVVCLSDATVVAAIELDDASHLKPSRWAADAKKQQALESAGIRLIRWQATALPDVTAIRTELC